MFEKIQLRNVCYTKNGTVILRNVNLTITAASTLIITGRDGCGKSTLLEICAGLLEPTSGEVLWSDRAISEFSPRELIAARKEMGYVFQVHALISNLSVFENVALPVRYHLDLAEDELRHKVNGQLTQLGIEDLADKLPEQLSLGQTRWAAFARALIPSPQLLILDELASGLDPISIQTLIATLKTLRAERKLTIVLASSIIQVMQELDSPVAVLDEAELKFLDQFDGPGGGPRSEIVTYLLDQL